MNLRFRFTIARKLVLGFGIIMIFVLTTSILTYTTLDDNMDENLGAITEIYTPSSSHLSDLNLMVNNSRSLIKNWVFIEQLSETPEKLLLENIHSTGYPELKHSLVPYVKNWEDEEAKALYVNIIQSIDTLFIAHQEIMESLSDFESYDNMMVTFTVRPKVEYDGEVMVRTYQIEEDLSVLIDKIQTEVAVSNKQMVNQFGGLQDMIVFLGILLVGAVITTAFILSRILVLPINSTKKIILKMGKGVLPNEPLRVRTDEIGQMAGALNQLVEGLQKTSEFALEIGDGNYESEFTPLSSNDNLGTSLILMRNNLKKAASDDDKRKEEDNQRSWSATGLAKFGELLRQSNEDMEEFSFRIISNLVKYLNANQGGFYIVNADDNENKYIELTSAYAYTRRKFIEKRFDVGVNLVGQCVQEEQTIFLTDLPQDYIKITSGLGEDTPRCLLIVPLKTAEGIFGVVEIAAFVELQPYQIEFVEKLGESIASTIASVKINMNTTKLLSESQEKSKQLALQEEQMRENIQSMQMAQKEARLRSEKEKERYEQIKGNYEKQIKQLSITHEDQQKQILTQNLSLEGTLKAINNSFGTVEYSLEGQIIEVNEKFIAMTGLLRKDLVGKLNSDFVSEEIKGQDEYAVLWNNLGMGRIHSGGHQYRFNKVERWFFESFTPVKDENGEFYKVIALSSDISKVRKKEEELQAKIFSQEVDIQALNDRIKS